MKQSLHLRLGQQLKMTPQLQQAIRLLQLSSLDLQQEVQNALDSNVMLELDSSQDDSSEESHISMNDSDTGERKTINDTEVKTSAKDSEQSESVDFDNNQNDIPLEYPLDSDWGEVYDNVGSYSGNNSYSSDNSSLFENNGKTEASLHEHLTWQMELTPFSNTDKIIANALIDAIDDAGYLSLNFDEILEGLDSELDIDHDEIEAVLHQIQNFDPPGIGARNVEESLLIQLRNLPADTRWVNEAQILVKRHLKLLAGRDFNTLKRRMKLDEEDLSRVIDLIKSLRPRPGGQINDERTQYITPDIYVHKINGRWVAHLNSESTPSIRINEQYLSLLKGAKKSTDMASIKDHLQEARWLIKSLQSRNDTLVRVSNCILDFQQDFFEYGEEHMRALVLADVAEVVGMHESTISRVTTQKYMHTPRGIFELKYFFSSHVNTSSGGEVSATAIRAIIKKLINQENTRKPLSDNKISLHLAEQNYQVARRTVAKYRESMAIPPSNERKNIA